MRSTRVDGPDRAMRFHIHHSTSYAYARRVALQPHRLMLCPRASQNLAVLAANVSCSPEAELDWTQDVFGNRIATAIFADAADRLVITSEATVEQSAAAWAVYRIAPEAHAFPFTYTSDETNDLGALLAADIADASPVAAWARGFVRSDPTDTLSLLKDINAGILAAVTYRVRDEEGTQSAADTLAMASGSCRDIAELFIQAVRHLGFGARAVSGYLFDPDIKPDDPGSTHAWAEVYLPGAGWIAFDPTQQRVGEANLIPVAVGRSNRRIMPITGTFAGAAEDFIGMEVKVRVKGA
jgi:transglutaminase-like putative cysteine protease